MSEFNKESTFLLSFLSFSNGLGKMGLGEMGLCEMGQNCLLSLLLVATSANSQK